MNDNKLPIPEKLKKYVEIKDNSINLKEDLPEELKSDYEELKKTYNVSLQISKMIEDTPTKRELTDEDKEFRYYCELYKEKFGKHAYIAAPSGTRQKTIEAIKTCLEKNEDLLDKLLYPNLKEDMEKGILY